jgi:hypothetical protein
MTESRVGESYYMSATRDKITVFYNDYSKNAVNDMSYAGTKVVDPSIVVLVAASMDKDSSFHRSVLLNLTKEDFVMLPRTGSENNGIISFYGVEIKNQLAKLQGKAIVAQVSMK